jgi:chromosome segregation ATPase
MNKLEDKTNLTWWDFIIHQREIKEEMDNDSRLLDENQMYLGKLETTLQEKNYEIKQLKNDYNEITRLLTLKMRDMERVSKQNQKMFNKIEKLETTTKKQKDTIDKLKKNVERKDEEIKVINDRLEYCRSHRRAPDIEELKAYTYDRKEVSKRIRRRNVSK